MSTPSKTQLLSDVRIRERNLKRGLIQPTDVEQHLSTLPDVAAQAETLPLGQPALSASGGAGHAARPAAAAAIAPAVVDDDDDDDDGDDDDDEEGDDE